MKTKNLSRSAWDRLLDAHPEIPVHLRRALERGVTSLTSRGTKYRLAGSFATRTAGVTAAPKPTKAKPRKVAASTRTAKPTESASARVARAAAESCAPDDDATRAVRHSLRAVTSGAKPKPRSDRTSESASARLARHAAEAADRALRDDPDPDSTLPPAV